MGMTIDKAIAKIWHCIVSIRDCVGNKEFVEALELSVETMRKYQKIKNIICKWEDGLFDDEGVLDAEVLEMISDEVEDGQTSN